MLIWKKRVTRSVIADSLPSHGLQPAMFLCPWDSPGRNTGVGCYSLLQGIFPTQRSNPGLLHCQQILYHLSHREAHTDVWQNPTQYCKAIILQFKIGEFKTTEINKEIDTYKKPQSIVIRLFQQKKKTEETCNLRIQGTCFHGNKYNFMKTHCSVFIFLLIPRMGSDGPGLGLVWGNTGVQSSDEGLWKPLALLRICCQALQEGIPQCGEVDMRLER